MQEEVSNTTNLQDNSPFDSLFDKIFYITADEKIRLGRLMKRNSLPQEEAQVRINAQNEYDKKEKSDFVIENNGDLQELENQVNNILNLILIR